MELQKIRELIEVLKASDLTELEFSEGDYKLRLVRRSGSVPSAVSVTNGNGLAPPAELHHETNAESVSVRTSTVMVRSPLFGILHLTASPDGPAFVQLGATVQQGDTLCIMEAMKIFHEVKANRTARVEAILGVSGQEVEAGAPLFQLAALG